MNDKNSLITLDNVSVSRNGKKILSAISWEINSGECSAIIGANGAGKSTLISVISGYTWATEGEVYAFGEKFGDTELALIRKKIGVLSQSRIPEFYPYSTVKEIVAAGLFGAIVVPMNHEIKKREWQTVYEKMESVKIVEMAEKYFGDLSTGEKMRALIARALAAKPALLLLDEPTAGLDLGSRVAVIKSLENMLRAQEAPAIAIVSHHLDEIPAPIHNVLLLKDGKVVASGKPSKTLNSKNLTETFGCKIDVICRKGHYQTIVKTEEWDI